jgi:hypothetical protein
MLAREYADARAEEIAKRIDLLNVHSTVGRTTEELCASVARSFISKPAEKDDCEGGLVAYFLRQFYGREPTAKELERARHVFLHGDWAN